MEPDLIFLRRKFCTEKFSLSGMAEHLAVSRSECSRYFKKAMNITEIAHAAGFCDASYFIRRFQEKLRCSPEKYRKRLQNTKTLD